MKKIVWKIVLALAAVALIGAALVWYRNRLDTGAAAFQTAPVTRGDLLVTISATGTLEPEEVVDVGAQVAGQILSFGSDVNGRPVDYGSQVAEGTVLARIDDSLYAAEVANAQAQVRAAQAGLQRAEADLAQFKAKLNQAERDWQRAKKLGISEALAQASYDSYRSGYETAVANMAVGEASILQAGAGLAQARAILRRAERNLGYCTIISPVKGVIIDRRVNIGQTVVATLNAPSLFLIAKDLTRMQVWVAVNEADIGKIYPGQPVTFTVDAFPGETFQGLVGKVRLNASMTQNVVTYTVEIITDNRDRRLLPYLTANVQFELQHLKNVLQVPNTALRWMPRAEQVAAVSPETTAQQATRAFPAESAPQSGGDSGAAAGRKPTGLLWTPVGEYVKPVWVRTGLTDGHMTVVEGEALSEQMIVVTGVKTLTSGAEDTSNPFTPKFPGRSRSRSER